MIIDKTVRPPTTVEEEPCNLAEIVDPTGAGVCNPRNIDRGKPPSVIEKTMQPATILVLSHDLAMVIDPEGYGFGSAREGNIERAKRSLLKD